MPSITETTVAEHRAVQHRAVLEAAERLIVTGGGKVPSLAEVAAEVGLARPSIYRYVSSQHDLMVQLLVLNSDTWHDQLEDKVKAAPSEAEDRVCAYVDAMLDLFAHGTHGPLMAAAQQFPEAFAEEKVQKSHAGFKDIVGRFCPEVSVIDLGMLNAAVMRASETAKTPKDLERATATLHRMARAIVAG
ncbi:TetR family transcriptional regulator [Corynebacterium jeikeium]|uniref:TetR/AcrR family transcriptional regulator n=1 Tax=Corynebacterium macclintockiae TaxID=2913501 RepID=UPI000556CACD